MTVKTKAMRPKTDAARKTKRTALTVSQPYSFQTLDALVRAVRCIAHYEDPLCELSHELRRSGSLSKENEDELRKILESIPSHEYLQDIEAARGICATPLTRSSTEQTSRSTRAINDNGTGKQRTRGKPSR